MSFSSLLKQIMSHYKSTGILFKYDVLGIFMMVKSSPMYASQGIAPWRSTYHELGLGENSGCFCEYVRQKNPHFFWM